MRLARGRYVTFLDGDDLYFPGRLARVQALVERQPDLELIVHDTQRLAENGTPRPDSYWSESHFGERVAPYLARTEGDLSWPGPRFWAFTSARFCPIHTSAVTIARARLEQEATWFPEDLIAGEDIDLWYRLAASPAVLIDARLSGYRERATSVTADRRVFLQGTLTADERNLARIGALLTPEERTYYQRRIARRYRQLGSQEERAGRLAAARAAYARSLKLEWRLSTGVLYARSFASAGARTWIKGLLPGRAKPASGGAAGPRT
jgi:hypothetical protein